MSASYSLDGISYTLLPVGPRFDDLIGTEDSDLDFTTDGGTRWLYRQYTRDHWEFTFRITNTQRAAFRAMHDAVDGQATPFYFKPQSSVGVVIYGRKEGSFLPRGIGIAANPRVYEYRLIIIGEVPSVSIDT